MRIGIEALEEEWRRYERKLADRERRAEDMTPSLEAAADDFLELEDAVFRSEGRIVGGWAPLSPGRLAVKRRLGLTERILESAPGGAVGKLRRSLTRKGGHHVRRIRADEMVAATSLGIAKMHDKGGTLTRRHRSGRTQTSRIPARPLVRLRREDERRWLGYQQTYLETGRVRVRGVGL